jgi:hypothetical protein
MNAIGAYLIVRSKEAGWSAGSPCPANDPLEGQGEPRPGLRERVRNLFRGRRRVVREPGFAATHRMVSEFVPQLRAYPYPPVYR